MKKKNSSSGYSQFSESLASLECSVPYGNTDLKHACYNRAVFFQWHTLLFISRQKISLYFYQTTTQQIPSFSQLVLLHPETQQVIEVVKLVHLLNHTSLQLEIVTRFLHLVLNLIGGTLKIWSVVYVVYTKASVIAPETTDRAKDRVLAYNSFSSMKFAIFLTLTFSKSLIMWDVRVTGL